MILPLSTTHPKYNVIPEGSALELGQFCPNSINLFS